MTQIFGGLGPFVSYIFEPKKSQKNSVQRKSVKNIEKKSHTHTEREKEIEKRQRGRVETTINCTEQTTI